MNKLAIILPIYKREEITTLCLKHLKYQSDRYGLDVFVVGSELDKSREIVRSFGFNYYEYENNPLSSKLNYILSKTKNYDGVILMGSDNFINDSIVELYLSLDLSKSIYYGFDDLHFYEVESQKLATKGVYYENKMSIGVARLFSKEALKKADYRLWRIEKNSGLDTCSFNLLCQLGIKNKVLKYTSEYFILDVKHELNITNHNIIYSCVKQENLSLINKKLPNISNEIINLKPKQNKTMKTQKIKSYQKKTKIQITKDIAGMNKGDVRIVRNVIAKAMINNGTAKKYEEEEKLAKEKAEAEAKAKAEAEAKAKAEAAKKKKTASKTKKKTASK